MRLKNVLFDKYHIFIKLSPPLAPPAPEARPGEHARPGEGDHHGQDPQGERAAGEALGGAVAFAAVWLVYFVSPSPLHPCPFFVSPEPGKGSGPIGSFTPPPMNSIFFLPGTRQVQDPT